MSNTLRNEAVPSTIGSKGIVYANGNIMYYKNPSGTVSQLNVANLNKTTVTKSTDYTLTASDCNGTKTFVFNRFNELDYNPLVAVLPTTATNLAVKIVNRSNSTLIVRPPVGSTIYMNGKTYTNTSELQLNYFNQNIELLAVDSTTWVGLTNNSTEYEIAKIIVNQLTYKCFILTTKGNLYFNGVNLDVSAGAFANFSDDIETTLATSKNVFLPIPQQVSKFEKSYVVDFQYIYVSNTDETLYVLDANGTVWTTGITNTSGKMGRTFSVGDGLQPVEANKSFNRIFAYNNLAFATTTDKELWAWGDNTNFRLGINDNLGTSIATPTRVLDSTFCIRDITIGSNYAMALSEDGRMFSWGVGLNGQLGLSVSTGAGTPSYGILFPVEPYSKCTWSTINLSKNSVRAGGLKTDGTAWTWGQPGNGEFGNGNTTQRPYNMVVGGLRFTRLSMGGNVSAGLTASGQLWTWGGNTYGQLGDNTSGGGTSKSSPVPVCGGHTFCQVSAGNNQVIALKSDGSAWMWGWNANGELGDGTVIAKSTPVLVLGGHVFCNVQTGNLYSIALKADGSAWTWGRNNSGVLGINSGITASTTPVPVCGGHTFCQVSLGNEHTVALRNDGSVWTWGLNSSGQLGDNSITAKCTPVVVCGGHTFCQISAGSNHVLALKSDGSVWAWGGNTGGCLGDNTTTNRSTPVAVCGGYTFCQISAGVDQSLAIRADGKQFFWGSAGSSNMSMSNDGSIAMENVPIPTQIETFSISQISICQIFANPVINTSFALASDGRLFGWGTNTAGIIGDGTIANKRTPVSICGGHTFCSIVQTETGTAGAIRNDGTLWLWGNNASGQLGNNSTTSSLIPSYVYTICTINTNFLRISASFQSIVLKSDGSAWSWGRNLEAQLGDGTLTNRSTPVFVVGNHNFCRIFSGGNGGATLALKADGSAWGWGSNNNGQLGDNTIVSKLSPVAVCGGHTFCQITTHTSHSLGLKSDGSAWSWGSNGFGQLGDNTIVNKSTPVAVCGGHTFCQISAGGSFTVALKLDGSAWSWGVGTSGVLGNNSVTSTLTPVAVCGGHTFCQISAKNGHTLALKSDGSVWSWGLNTISTGGGPLGDNTTTNRSTPVAVCGGHTFCQISAGENHSLGLKADGSAWTWGRNDLGQLGDNTIIDKSTPVAVCGGHTFCQISAGNSYNLALKADGSVWSWGSNASGQLGDNTTTNRSTPVAVCSHLAPFSLTSICEVKSTSTNFYARQANGTLWSWGNYNSTTIFGKLGDGTFSNTTLVPVSVCTIPNETVCKIFAYPNIGLTASINSPIVYTRNNKLFSWGSNFKNVVGVKGRYLPSLCARSVSLGYSVRDVLYGYALAGGGTVENIAILRTDGSVWTWGRPDSGRLGDGTTTSKNTPVSVCGNHTFCSIYTTGFNTTLAFGGLKADGSAWSWGNNSNGQLGDNTTVSKLTPVAVCGGHTFCQIDGFRDAVVALKADGSAWSWGINTSGVLGDNTVTGRATPVAVCGGHTFCQIGMGSFFTVALKADGSAWSWGINTNGQLGDNSITSRLTPVAVCGGHTFCSIYVATNHVLALKADGSAWSWGFNPSGILGDNSTTQRSTPVAVCGGYTFCSVLVHKNNLKQISTTQPPTMIMKDVNNNIYMWGYGTFEFNYGRGVKLYFMSTTESSRTPNRIYNSFLSSVCSLLLGKKYDTVGLNFSKYSLLKGNDGNYYYWGFVEGLLYDDGSLPNTLLFNEPKYLLTPQEITKFYEVY